MSHFVFSPPVSSLLFSFLNELPGPDKKITTTMNQNEFVLCCGKIETSTTTIILLFIKISINHPRLFEHLQ